MKTMITSSAKRSHADCSPDSTAFWLRNFPSSGLTISLCEMRMIPGLPSENCFHPTPDKVGPKLRAGIFGGRVGQKGSDRTGIF